MGTRDILNGVAAFAAASGASALIGVTALQAGSAYHRPLLYGGIGAIAVGALIWLALIVFREKAAENEVSKVWRIDQSVSSHNQSGGITARNVRHSDGE